MKKYIQYVGYVMINDDWCLLNDKMCFPVDTIEGDPYDYAHQMFKEFGIEHYLFTYYEIEMKE